MALQRRYIALSPPDSPARGGADARCDDGVGQGGFVRHVVIAPAGEPQGVIAETDRRVFGGIIGRATGWQAFDDSVVIGVGDCQEFRARLSGLTDQSMAAVKRSPKRTANCDLAMDHSRCGMIHCRL